jgi:thiol-disulfide isomerase/thioredoxin
MRNQQIYRNMASASFWSASQYGWKTIFVLVVCTFLCYGVELDQAGFYKLTSYNKDKNGIIMFYQPWCSHSITIKPDWDQLEDKLQNIETVFIARVNCEVQKELCEEKGIHSYPTIHVYYSTKNSETSSRAKSYIEEEYKEGQSYEALYDFVDRSLVQRCNIRENEQFCSEKSRKFSRKWQTSKSLNEIVHEIDRLQNILDENTPIDLRSWIRERQHILHQLVELHQEDSPDL